MSFRLEDLNNELFSKVIAFSYSIGTGLGGPGAIIMLTNDGKTQMEKVLFSLLEEWKERNSDINR